MFNLKLASPGASYLIVLAGLILPLHQYASAQNGNRVLIVDLNDALTQSALNLSELTPHPLIAVHGAPDGFPLRENVPIINNWVGKLPAGQTHCVYISCYGTGPSHRGMASEISAAMQAKVLAFQGKVSFGMHEDTLHFFTKGPPKSGAFVHEYLPDGTVTHITNMAEYFPETPVVINHRYGMTDYSPDGEAVTILNKRYWKTMEAKRNVDAGERGDALGPGSPNWGSKDNLARSDTEFDIDFPGECKPPGHMGVTRYAKVGVSPPDIALTVLENSGALTAVEENIPLATWFTRPAVYGLSLPGRAVQVGADAADYLPMKLFGVRPAGALFDISGYLTQQLLTPPQRTQTRPNYDGMYFEGSLDGI